MKQIGICTKSHQTSYQAILEHIGTSASILADDDTSWVGITIALTESIIIPAQEAANLVGMVCC